MYQLSVLQKLWKDAHIVMNQELQLFESLFWVPLNLLRANLAQRK